MNRLLFIGMLGFGINAEGLKIPENTLCICDMHATWLSENSIDNKSDKKWSDVKSDKKWNKQTILKNKDITRIYKYHKDLQDMVNLQIRIELNAFYNYLGMSRFFTKYDEDRPGFAKYFQKAAMEELEHAEAFMKYQQMRGGDVKLYSLPSPIESDWKNAKDVLTTAFELEKNVTDQILCLHAFAADRFADTDFLNFLEEKIIPEQYEGMKEIKTHIKTLDRACPMRGGSDKVCDIYPLYEMRFDEELLQKQAK